MVTELAFFTDDPSSNIADAYSFFFRILFKKNENKQKETDVGPFLKKVTQLKKKYLCWLYQSLSRIFQYYIPIDVVDWFSTSSSAPRPHSFAPIIFQMKTFIIY